MQIDKQQIVEFLQARGLKDNARQAEQELPDPVDTDENHAQLSLLGVDLEDLAGGIGGLGGIGDQQSSDSAE